MFETLTGWHIGKQLQLTLHIGENAKKLKVQLDQTQLQFLLLVALISVFSAFLQFWKSHPRIVTSVDFLLPEC
jgi:hypothetical protein